MKFLSGLTWAACTSGLFSAVAAHPPSWHRRAEEFSAAAPRDNNSNAPGANYTVQYFDQPIDHFSQSEGYGPQVNGTFKQRYYLQTTHYKQGGPVFLYLAGEGTIDGNTALNTSLIEEFVRTFNGIGVILENRYYGESNPYNTSSTDELRFLTTEQVIADHDYFARHVKLPGVQDINAPKTPWIVYGGSYPGALSAFTMKKYGNSTFYAGISSSGVIHGQVEYPQWYDPIQLLAPQDCVASINDIVDKMDSLVDAKNDAAIQKLKEAFGLGALNDTRDFAATIAFPIGGPLNYPTNSWQEIHWNPSRGKEDFFNFCRNVTNPKTPTNNSQVDQEFAQYTNGEPWKNLGNYAAYIKQVVLPLCDGGDYNSADCFGTQHPDHWANTTNSDNRSWLYTTCTEFGAYQAAQPKGKKSLISRVINKDYTQQWCNWSFPKGKHHSIPSSPDNAKWNVYGDFNLTADRLFFIDGSADPWRDLCYHSNFAPQRQWSDAHPEHLINGALHVWDLRTLNDIDAEPQFVRETNYLELRTVERWLDEFKDWKPQSK